MGGRSRSRRKTLTGAAAFSHAAALARQDRRSPCGNPLVWQPPLLQAGSARGQPLSSSVRALLEPRLGYDFGNVRVHADARTARAARGLNARAFTVGEDIGFAAGQYTPTTTEGRRLLAHELTHVVQQRSAGQKARRSAGAVRVHRRMARGTVAGDWLIRTRTGRGWRGRNPFRRGGRRDEELAEQAFRDICPLITRRGNRIQVPMGGSSRSHPRGCRCLREIERGLLTSGRPTHKTSRPPAAIQVEPYGWSRCDPHSDPVEVSVRHPEDPFQWGYWTTTTWRHPTERRHIKPFWQTVAHEICGHVLTYVRTRGRHAGSRRDNPRHHDPAIELENWIAAEHRVPRHKQRGTEFTPSGHPATRHRGESFLAAAIPDFRHRSARLPPGRTRRRAITSAVSTIQSFYRMTRRAGSPRRLFVELVGSAYANEGGRALALRRARAVRAAIRRRTRLARRYLVRARVAPGRSTPRTCQVGKVVDVYLFHDLRSAGP